MAKKTKQKNIKKGQQASALRPKISVVVFSYNFEKFIGECLDSLVKQTLKPYEIIVCDDHSSDNSWEIIEQYKAKYPKLFKIFRHEQNIGHIKNGKFGKDQAKGEWVSVIDGDDRWLPRKLELEWEALKKNPKAKTAYSNVIMIDENGNRTGLWYDGNGPEPPSGDVFVQAFSKRFFPGHRSLFRNQLMERKTMQKLGYGDEKISIHADWDLKIRLAAQYEVAYSGAALVEYREHPGGIHHTQRGKIYESAKYVVEKNKSLIEKRTPEEQQYILENLRSLLTEEQTYSQKKVQQKIITKSVTDNTRGGNLIFIISQPRSGSTLLQRILGAHEQVYTVSEPWLMLQPLFALKEKGMQAKYEWELGRNALQDLLQTVPEKEALYYDAVGAMGETIYNRLLGQSGKKIFLDKTPRYYLIIPELKRTFPKAKFVFILRNPLSVLSSVLVSWYRGNNIPLLKQNANYMDLTEAPHLILDGIRLLGQDASVIHYEDLVTDPETEIRRLCQQIHLPFQKSMIEYGKSEKLMGRYGDQEQINRFTKPVKSSLEKWVTHLTSGPELITFATDYLNTLGEQTVTNMGYSFSELHRGLNQHSGAGQTLPKISVVTPSFNNGNYIEQTILSVVEQNYPNFEHFVMDGGSTDGTVRILKKYKHLHWVSEKDNGQSHALNKGFRAVSGEIIAWINSDDWYEPNVFHRVAAFFMQNPDKNIVMGNCNLIDESGRVFDVVVNHARGFDELANYKAARSIPTQPAIFFRKKLLDVYGLLDESLFYAMDYDLWLRFAMHNYFYHINETFANYRFHPGAKGGDQDWDKFMPEWEKVSKKYRQLRNTPPLISVVIPCYNYADYLPEAVESVVNQTFQDFEIIIVNDGSTDNSKEVAENLIKQYPSHQIYLLDQPNSGQPAISRNNGIKRSRGKYIVPLDADDKLAPKGLELFYNALQSLADQPCVAHGTIQYFGTDNNFWHARRFKSHHLLRRGHVPSCSMFHRSVWELQGGYRLNVPGYEDWDFWIGALEIGAEFVPISEVVMYYRKTENDSLIDKAVLKHEWYVAKIIKNHPHLYEEIENEWADYYLDLHPDVPQSKKVHGPDDRFPQVTAFLVDTYPEHYSQQEIAWAKEYLERHPFLVKKKVEEITMDLEREIAENSPAELFDSAWAFLNAGHFKRAVQKMIAYRYTVAYDTFAMQDNRAVQQPLLSVVIVAYQTKELLLDCLYSLDAQKNKNFEVIVVDNGGNESIEDTLKQKSVLYIKTPTNVYLSEGRNIGAHFARGKYLAFLDDDAVVPEDYTASIIKAFATYDIVALRGKVVPKSKNKRNKKAGHYDLGEIAFPHTIDAEGNSAFVKEVYLQYKGMDPLLFGHEGSEWSYRYFMKEKQYKLIYWPETVIYHDYAFSESKLEAKENRHRIMWDYLNYKDNAVGKWLSIYNRFEETADSKKMGNSLLQKRQMAKEPKSAAPLISICIVTYNREHYLKDALDSALNQQGAPFEVVVVDDGSTDNTAELVRSINDSRIRYIYKEHTNAPDTRNRAIAEAQGTYILWLDSDDYLQENILNVYKEYINVFPEVDLFYGFLYVVDEDKNLSKEITYQDWYRKNDSVREQLVFSNQFPNPGMLVKKESYALVGTYNPEFIRAHDYEWFSRAVDFLNFKSITQHVCYYRAHSKSLSPEYGNTDKLYEAKISDAILQKHPLKKLFTSLNWRKEPGNVLRAKIYMLVVEHMFKLREPAFAEKYYGLAANEHSGMDVKTFYLEMKKEYLQAKKDIKNKPVLQTEKETGLTVTAIISAYNEGDVIYHVIGDLVQQNIQVYLIDHHSTDNTVAEASKWLGLGLIKIETFPEDSGYQIPDKTYSWRFILKRKEEIAKKLGHGWYIHADADEFRESPWKELNLRQGIERVDREGFNAINFLIYDFKPTDNRFKPGADVRNYLKYFSSPRLAYDEVQLKCWKYEGQEFNLWETGGHEVRFEQRKIYPLPFILRHYPIRSQQHGLNKIFNERKNRWDEEERKAKWHAQYDHIQDTEHNFLHDPQTLKKYDREVVCREILQAFGNDNNGETDETKPLVSIIFLTFNALKYTKLAVQSVLEHTRYPYELIIVDNHSTDGTRKYLMQLSKQHAHIKTILNKKNKGFAAGNNQGVEKAKGKYVLVLNNDVLVADGWLGALVDALEKDPAIGMVGPITNHISGLQRVTGVPYKDVSGFPAFASQVAKVNKNKITPRRRIAGFAMLLERDFYLKLNGFDESFGIGNYEDDDFCLRVREAGKAIMVHEGVYIHHFGSQTFKANKMDYNASLDEKGKRFKEKWPKINYQELLELENPLSVYIGEQLSAAQDAMERGSFEKALEALQLIIRENPIHSTALFLAAVAENQLQHYDAALVYLNKLIGLEPDNALAYNQIGLNFKAQGDLEAAQQAFLKAIESDPGLVDAQRNFGDALIEAGDFENGVQTFATILKNHPNDVPALLYMSQIHLDAGKWQRAQAYAQKVLDLDPKNVLAGQLLELIRQENEVKFQPEQTSASLQPAMEELLNGRYERAVRAFETSLQIDPNNEEGLYGLALSRMGLKDFDGALNALDALNRLHPDSPEVFNQIGLALMGKNEWDAAETAFQYAIKLNPDFIDAQRNYGDWLIRRERYEEGIVKFQEIILNHPDDVPALLYLSQLNFETGRFEDAAVYVNKAVSVEPENPIALQLKTLIEQESRSADMVSGGGTEESIARANTLLEQGKVEQARVLYSDVLEKEPGDISARFGLGLCALSQNDLQTSAEYFKTIVEQEADFAPAYNQLGTIALIQKEYQQAVEYFSQSLERNKDQIHVCNLLADALIFNGDYQQGVQLLVNIAEENPENTETLFKLGEIYMELNRQKEAKILFKRVLQIDPQHQDAQSNLDIIVKN